MVVLASAGGNTVPAIARLAATSQDRVREMIHRFNELGMASLDPQWAGGRPRRITTDDEDFIVETATTRPEALGLPFTRWSLRKLAAYLRDGAERPVRVSAERLRQILRAHDITFQRTRTWKESNDPEREAKLARIEEVIERYPQRCFAFDEFGPLQIRPVAGSGWSRKGRPQRQRANYNKLHGVRQFHGCYSLGEDTLWGAVRQQKSAANTLAALKSIRARRLDTLTPVAADPPPPQPPTSNTTTQKSPTTHASPLGTTHLDATSRATTTRHKDRAPAPSNPVPEVNSATDASASAG